MSRKIPPSNKSPKTSDSCCDNNMLKHKVVFGKRRTVSIWNERLPYYDGLEYVPYSNRLWPTAAVAGKADRELTLLGDTVTCHIGGPNSVNPDKILLVYSM